MDASVGLIALLLIWRTGLQQVRCVGGSVLYRCLTTGGMVRWLQRCSHLGMIARAAWWPRRAGRPSHRKG